MTWSLTATDDQVRVNSQTGQMADAGGNGIGAGPGMVQLTSARNEYVSFQIAVGPLTGREDPLRVTFADLAGPARISKDNFEAFVAGAIKNGNDWYPEVLFPLDRGRLESAPEWPSPRPFHSIWVDLFVPAETAPGDYTGSVTVREGRHEQEVHIHLTVLSLTIPAECSLLCDLNNYADGISAGYPMLVEDLGRHRTPLYRRIESAFFRAAHEHRACLHYLPYYHSGHVVPTFAPDLVGNGKNKRVKSWADFDKHLAGYFDGSAFSGTRRGPVPVPRFWLPLNLDWPADFAKFGRKGYETEWRNVGREMVEHFRRKGWTRTSFDMFPNHKQRYRFYPWDCEEIRFAADNAIHYTLRDLWRGTYDRPNTQPVKFAYTLGITWTYGIDTLSPMRDFIDVWICGSGMAGWYHEQLADLHARNQQVWICGGAPAIKDPPIAMNWWPLQTWMRSLDGFMPWYSMAWGNEPFTAPPGDGRTTLFYPGAPFGLDAPLCSQRLKVLRNAMQTVEWFELAAAKAGRDAVEARVNAILGYRGLSDWLQKKPAFASQKPPSEWTNADFATEEPPIAGWQSFNAEHWRAVKAAAAEMAAR